MSEKVTIYVLKLEKNKYYIGRTNNIETRIARHKAGEGSDWTKKYKFIKLLEQFEGDDFDEDKCVIKYMDKYGINNVRGGIYSNIILTMDQHLNIRKSIYGAKNKCLACGSNEHFIAECKEPICFVCGRTGHLVSNCRAKTHVLNGKLNGCYRCGRSDHWKFRCNRTNDIFGRPIESSCIIS